MGAVEQAAYAARRLEADPEGWRRYRREIAYAFRQKNPEKNAAWCRVYKALRRGELVRPDSCSSCGRVCKPEASHDDYSKLLEVEWLCRPCHARKDAR